MGRQQRLAINPTFVSFDFFSYDLHRIHTVKKNHQASDRNQCRHFQRNNINCCYSSSSQSYSTRCTSDRSESKPCACFQIHQKKIYSKKSQTLDQTFSSDNVMGNAIKGSYDGQTIPYFSKYLSVSRFLTYKINKTNKDSRIFRFEKKVFIN